MDQRLIVIKTGIDDIDNQHQQLVKCLDELREFAGGTYGFAAAFTALNTLMDYVHFHFAFEEQFLANCHYPFLEEHKAEHKLLAAEVGRLWSEVEAGQDIEAKLVATIRKWILDHINAEDIEYAKFLESEAQT